jgi:hypothetical protein
MKLESLANGSWCFHTGDPVDGTSVKIVLHARDSDGNPCPEPRPKLIEAAQEAERNATRMRDSFIERLVDPDQDLLDPNETAIKRPQSQSRLLHISIEQFPTGAIETCGYVADACSRVWQVGDDYIEGWYPLDEFTP